MFATDQSGHRKGASGRNLVAADRARRKADGGTDGPARAAPTSTDSPIGGEASAQRPKLQEVPDIARVTGLLQPSRSASTERGCDAGTTA